MKWLAKMKARYASEGPRPSFRWGFAFSIMLALALVWNWSNASRVVAQGFIGIFQNGTPTGPSAYGTGDSTSGLYFGTGYVGTTKHVTTGNGSGVTPALSSCGTSPSLTTGSSDTAGKFTMGTSASNACTLTFGTAYTTAPFCVVQNATTGAGAFSATVSATTIVIGGTAADSSVFFYHCTGPSGG